MTETEEQTSLRAFIKSNHDLLSTMAIFIAIAGFVGNIPISWLADTLTCLAIAGVVVLWFELNALIPKKGTFRLWLFRYVLIFGFYGFVFYWLLEYRKFWSIALFIPVTGLLTYMAMQNLKQFGQILWIRKTFGIGMNKNVWQKVCVGVFAFFCFVGWSYIFSASIGASYAFNFILDIVKLNFK